MRVKILIYWCCIVPNLIFAQESSKFVFKSFQKNIAFVYYDSISASPSTIIEYPKFIVIVELPFIDEGANKATDLTEDIPKAKQLLAYLKHKYNKPVKYVLSSHWHLHSISGITPFLESGAKLIVSKTNWKYSIDNGLMAPDKAKSFSKNTIEITKDTTLLSEYEVPIKIYFLDKTYINKPTEDYLFFYFPTLKTLHASCMCAISTVDFEKNKNYIYSDRVTDLNKVITQHNLEIEYLIKLTSEKEKEKSGFKLPVFTNDYFTAFMKNGNAMETVIRNYTSLDIKTLKEEKQKLLYESITKKVNPAVLNAAVYSCLKSKDYERALALAELLVLYRPDERNYIDTLGETHYFAGNMEAAEYYSYILNKLDPKATAPIKSWEQNKANNHP